MLKNLFRSISCCLNFISLKFGCSILKFSEKIDDLLKFGETANFEYMIGFAQFLSIHDQKGTTENYFSLCYLKVIS